MEGGAGSGPNATLRWGCALFALACATITPACTGIAPCKKRGLSEACKCDGGAMGTRSCLPELVWDHCECGSLPHPDAGVSGMSGGGMSGAAGMSGGSGTSGSMAPAGSGGSGSGGSSGSVAPNPDEDAGIEPMSDGGAGSGGSGGTGGMSGSGGSGGTTAMGSPYKACTTTPDCGPGSICESATDPDDSSAMVHACAPACSDVSACPTKPAGSYDAMLVCVSGHCRLDCSPPLLEADLSCPSGMRCAGELLSPSYCF